MSTEEKVAKILKTKRKTLAVAESCSGGLLSDRLTNIPGSSTFLKFTLVAYSYEAKINLLKVPKELLKRYGAVSRQVAAEMSINARKLLDCDYSVAITGIAGPTGATKRKPIGLTFISISSRQETHTHEFIFKGGRIPNKNKAVSKSLELLLEELTKKSKH